MKERQHSGVWLSLNMLVNWMINGIVIGSLFPTHELGLYVIPELLIGE